MDLFILDSNLRRVRIIDQYESLIWTDRFLGWGNFELLIASTPQIRAALANGTWLGIADSDTVMVVETYEDTDNIDGRKMVKFSGRSFEQILDDRTTVRPFVNNATNVWTMYDTPGNIMRHLFRMICVENTVNPGDKIPFYVTGNPYPADTLVEPQSMITMEIGRGPLYKALEEIGSTYDLGFRIIKGQDDSKLYFNVYAGSDRTSQQISLPSVIFSPDLENLTNVTELSSMADYKNVAYVEAKNGSRTVYAPGFENVTGFARRTMYVNATNVDLAAGTQLQDELQRVGLDALAQQTSVTAIDGELSQLSRYRYLKDYYLGDLIEIRNDEGTTNLMRVVEQIFISDGEGVRAYPALATNLFVTPGSWLSWDSNQVWADAPGTWATASG